MALESNRAYSDNRLLKEIYSNLAGEDPAIDITRSVSTNKLLKAIYLIYAGETPQLDTSTAISNNKLLAAIYSLMQGAEPLDANRAYSDNQIYRKIFSLQNDGSVELDTTRALSINKLLQALQTVWVGSNVNQEPYFEGILLIPEGGGSFEADWDDPTYFPDAVLDEWGDITPWLMELGEFTVDWGDGNLQSILFHDPDNGRAYSHTYENGGTYTIKIYSPYVFIYSEYLTEVVKLINLKSIVVELCTNLESLNFTNSKNIEGIYYGGNSGVTYVDTSNLTSLKVLRFNNNSNVTDIPDITNNGNIVEISAINCPGLDASDIDALLTTLGNEYPYLLNVNLAQTPPIAYNNALKLAAEAANPQALFYME